MGEAKRRAKMAQKISEHVGDFKDRICECGGKFFTEALTLKELPAPYSKTGKPETMIFKIGFFCRSCGKFMTLRPKAEEEKPGSVEGVEEEPKNAGQ
jgi:hypothetical protein